MLSAMGCASPFADHAFDDWPALNRALHATDRAGGSSPDDDFERTGVVALLPEQAELDDFIRFALEHHPGLAAALHRWRAAIERIPQARSLPDPQASFGVVLDETDRSAQYMGERYSISQTFPWFGKLDRRGDLALEEARAEGQRYKAERLKRVERLTVAYTEYAYLKQGTVIARANRDWMDRLASIAQTQFRAGTITLADVHRAQIELERLDEQVRSMQDLLSSAAADLNSALGRPAHAPLPASPHRPSSMKLAALPPHSDEQWLARARRHNPELAALRHEAAMQRQALVLARREYWPDVMVELEYAREGSGRMAMIDGGGSDMLMGKVSVNLPLWRERLDAAVSESHARFAEALRRVQEQQNSLESDLKRALFAYRDAGRKRVLYGETLIPRAHESLAATEAAYRAGRAAFSDLLDVQRVLLEFELAHERAAVDQMQAVVRVWMLAGSPDDVAEGTELQHAGPRGSTTKPTHDTPDQGFSP